MVPLSISVRYYVNRAWYKLTHRIVYKYKLWKRTSFFGKLSQDIAHSWYWAGRKGIDFGDMSFKDFVKYYCRNNTKHQWYRFFVSYKIIDEEMERYYEMEMYE